MARARSCILGGLFVMSLGFAEAKPALGEINLRAAIDAIQESRCHAEYWADPRPSRPLSVLPVAVRSEGEVAYAWVEGLDGPEWATFYVITRKGAKAVATSSSGYNKKLVQGSVGFQESWNQVFGADSSKHSFGGDFRIGELRVPFRCALVLGADTTVKREMVDAVQRTMTISLTQFNRTGANYPERVRIVIANFNTDFAATYVLVRETGELFGVLLNDPVESPPADAEYLVWQPYNPSDWPPIRRRIMSTGIKREIRVGK